MPQKLLSDLGAGCTQTTTDISLSKSDLGLTGASVTLDQLLAAIVIKCESLLTETQFNNEIEQNLYISPGFLSSTTKNEQTWIVRSKQINFGKPDTETTINPNEY